MSCETIMTANMNKVCVGEKTESKNTLAPNRLAFCKNLPVHEGQNPPKRPPPHQCDLDRPSAC